MKRIIFSISLVIVALAGYAQYPSPIATKPNNTFVTVFNGVSADSVLYFPTGCGIPTDTTFLHAQQNGGKAQKLRKFAIYGDSCGGKTYLWNPSLQSWSAIGKGIGVDTIYRTRGKDSIQFKINGVYYSILDSASSGGYDSTIMQPIYRSDTAKQAIRASISIKADTTGGVIRRSDTTNKYVNRLANNATNDSIIYYIGSTRYAIKDNGGSGGSDSGFSVQKSSLSGVPIQKAVVGAARFVLWDTSAATNPGAIVTPPRLKQKLDSIGLLADSIPVNNLLSVNAGTVQLGGTSVKGNTSLGFHDTDTLSLDSLKYLKMPHLQLLTASDQTYIVVRDTISGIFYNIPASRSDTTGVAAIKAAGGIPFAYYDSATNKIKFQAAPIGPYAFSGNYVVATTTDTACLNCPTPDALAAVTIKGTTNMDGAVLGTQILTTGKDSLQTRFVTINTTGTSSTVLKTTYTLNGSGNDTTNVQPLQIDLINASTSKKQSASLGITGRFNSNAPGFSYTLWNLTAAQGANDTTAGGTLIGATLNNPGTNGYKPFEYGMHIGATGSLGNIGTAYGLQIDDLPGFKTAGYGLRIGTMKATGAKSLDVFGTADIHFGAVLRTDSAIIMSNVTSGSSLSQFAVYDRADSRIHYMNLGAGLINRNDSIVATGVSGSGVNTVKKIITQASHPFTANEPIYLDTTSTTWHAADTTNFAMAVVDSVIDANTFEATFAGTYNNIHGLSTGKYYYVTMPAGSTTTISPTKSQPVFIPINTTTILVNIQRPVDFLGAVSGGGTGAVASVNGLTGVVVTKSADSLKKLPIDTSAAPRNGYLLTFDSTNHKWYLTAPATGGVGSTPTWQQVFNQQVGGAVQTKPDTVLLTNGNYLRLKGGQVFMDTATFGNATHTATQGVQVANGLYANFINTDLNTAAGSSGTAEFKQLNLNSPSTQAFKLEFQNGGVNTFNAKMTGNGNNTLGTQYFYLGANSSQIATPVSAYTGGSIQFDTRLLPPMKFFVKYAGATADSSAMTIDTNAVVIIGSQVQAVGSGLLQSASKTKHQLGLLYDATHSALFKVNSAGALGISSLKGLAISSSALPTGSTSDSVMVISGDSVKKVAQNSIAGTGKAANDSVAGSGYTTNAHLYKTIDSTKAAYGAPAWGTYTATFTNTTNIASSSFTGGGYTKLGNCVHVFIAGTLSTTLGVNTVTTLTISLPGSYSPAASAIDVGHGVIDLQGAILPNISGVVSTTGSSTVTFQFQSSSVISSAPFQLSFDYFY